MARTKKTVRRKQADEVIVITSESGEQAGDGESVSKFLMQHALECSL